MSKYFGLAVLLACVAGAAQSPLAAQTPVDVDVLGPQPGARVPEFSATDQFGRTQTLKSLLGPNGAMLVFSRSADW
jgi:hypothetical protein